MSTDMRFDMRYDMSTDMRRSATRSMREAIPTVPVRRTARATLALACAVGITSCGSDTTDPGRGTATLTISPRSIELRHPGDTVRLALGGSAASGAATWSSSDPRILSVSSDGLVEATGYGTARVSARVGEAEVSASIRVVGETSMSFLKGTWTTDDELTPDGVTGGGTVVVVDDQGALRAVWRGTLEGVPVEVVSLVAARGSGWSLARADGVRGTFALMDGTLAPGRIELDSGDRLGAGWRERVVFSDFTSSSFRWTVEESEDEGATWTPRWRQLLQRAPVTAAPPILDTVSPSCTASEYGEFDFWRGNWRVRVAAGGLAGTNLVHRLAGCGVQENWRDASSGGGVSLNMYDPRSDAWTQFYVASTGGSIELSGHVQGGAMVLQGPSGTVVDRITWSTLEDGRVRQLWERSTAGGGFSTYFDGYYERR